MGFFFRLNEKFLRRGRYRGNNIDSVRASSFMIQGDRKDKSSEKGTNRYIASRSVELVSVTIFFFFCRGHGDFVGSTVCADQVS